MRVNLNTPEFITWFHEIFNLSEHRLEVNQSPHYLKLVSFWDTGERMDLPFCFIDRATGEIYRAGNWRFPSKLHSRGNIFDVDNGLSQMTSTGPAIRQVGCPKGYKYDYKRTRGPKVHPKDRMKGEPKPLPPLINVPDTIVTQAFPTAKGNLPVRVFTPGKQDMSFWSKED